MGVSVLILSHYMRQNHFIYKKHRDKVKKLPKICSSREKMYYLCIEGAYQKKIPFAKSLDFVQSETLLSPMPIRVTTQDFFLHCFSSLFLSSSGNRESSSRSTSSYSISSMSIVSQRYFSIIASIFDWMFGIGSMTRTRELSVAVNGYHRI